MPYTLTSGGVKSRESLTNVDYDYTYPDGMDLKPGSELHERLKAAILERVRRSRNAMSGRYKAWRELDRVLTAYIKVDEAEEQLKEQDPRKPVSIVVPVSYAVLETLLTYFTVAFLDEPIFRYTGVGPEDEIGALLLERVVAVQARRAKMGLALHTMWRDSLVYGFGVASPVWTRKRETAVERINILGLFSRSVSRVKTTAEYNELLAIDPYMYLPDPNVPVHEVQRGEYVGWIVRTNYISLLRQEREGDLFNVRYLKHVSGRSIYYNPSESGRYDKLELEPDKPDAEGVVDVIYMYVDLVPSDWDLGASDEPEKWVFALAGDEVIIQAQPLGLNHGMFPVAVTAPDFDGHSLCPVSRIEVVYGLQEVMNWLFNSHVANVRKAVNDMLIVDPSMVNMNDLTTPEPGKIVRLRRAAWGRGVDAAVKQLGVVDVTSRHIQDAMFVMDAIQRVSAAVDSLQGIMRRTSERRSATEARDVRIGALSRLERAAKMASLQAMYDLGYMLASQTQQLMERKVYVKIAGRMEEVLRAEFGERAQVEVSPGDLDVNYDVVVHDGTSPMSQPADIWVQLFQIIASQPELHQAFDIVRVFKHIARLLGAKNVDDFEAKPTVSAAPMEEIMRQAELGNLVPVEEVVGEGGIEA